VATAAGLAGLAGASTGACLIDWQSREDLDFAERDEEFVRSLEEEVASGRGLRVAGDRRVGAQRQRTRNVGAGRALVHHRGLGGPRGHVGQPNHERAHNQ